MVHHTLERVVDRLLNKQVVGLVLVVGLGLLGLSLFVAKEHGSTLGIAIPSQ